MPANLDASRLLLRHRLRPSATCVLRVHARTARTAASTALRAGIAMNPDADPRRVLPFLGAVDLVLCMTVFPGFGGQAFMPAVLDSIRFLAAERARRGADFRLEVYPDVNHGFAVTDTPVYNKDASERHWTALLKLYRETLG